MTSLLKSQLQYIRLKGLVDCDPHSVSIESSQWINNQMRLTGSCQQDCCRHFNSNSSLDTTAAFTRIRYLACRLSDWFRFTMGVCFSRFLKPKKRLKDLSNDCLMEVLERLSQGSLLKMARVNKRLNKLVEINLQIKIKKVVVVHEETKNCCHKRFERNEVLYFDSMFAAKQLNKVMCRQHYRNEAHEAQANAMFLKTLARFPSVKSINFGWQELTDEVLREVAELCPEIECLILRKSVVVESVWNDFFSRFGHQIVHFKWMLAKYVLDLPPLTVQILEMITLMCPNIKHVDYSAKYLTTELIQLLGQLPKDCYVGVKVYQVDYPFGDTIDRLSTCKIDWSVLGRRDQQLKELKFSNANHFDLSVGVEFALLKQLKVDCPMLDNFDFLAANRFPTLEVLDFLNTDHLITEDFYDRLFRVTPELKEMRIQYYYTSNALSTVLPGPAICQLKKLEQFQLKVSYFMPVNLIRKLPWYLDEIPTLKRFSVKVCQINLKEYNELIKSGESMRKSIQWIDELMKLKAGDNRFEIGDLKMKHICLPLFENLL